MSMLSDSGVRRRVRTAIVAVFSFAMCFGAHAQGQDDGGVVYLDQGWTPKIRELFYFTPQGSHLMPYDWFLSLEQPDDPALFASRENLSRFGWLFHTGAPSRLNVDDLPIGFTRDPGIAPGGGNWLGMTCSACHTGNVEHNGTVVRIDGGPTMGDFGQFLTSLSRAVMANHPAVDEQKFTRFAGRVLGAQVNELSTAELVDAYETFAVRFVGRAWMRTPPLHAGPGRVDALTQIVNSLAVFDLGRPDNLHPPLAPTSYPFLWLAPKLEWVQWNPIASNPIARNAGETLGVFGNVNLGLDQSQPLFTSSILFDRLYNLEQWVDDLTPPRWREDIFGTIDEDQWRQGAAQFQSDCRACHNMPPFDMTSPADNIAGVEFIKISRVPYRAVGTDPFYVESLAGRFVQTGALAQPLFGGRGIVAGGTFFTSSVGAAVRKGLADAGLTLQQLLAYNGYRFYPKKDPNNPDEALRPYSPPSLTDLKAGPLLGIWATGPFLHNGSVPNIYELLSPPEERSDAFWVGSQELDVENLGFDSTEGAGHFRFDATLPGNRNSGHLYPRRPYTHEQRMAVIEFLKDPERFSAETSR